MKITGGQACGRSIDIPDHPGVRPTGSLMREALFNILGKLIENAHFLDLFAGSGLIGFEALSRGAGYLTVVEKTGICVDTIRANAAKLGYEKKTKIIHTDFRKAINSLNADQFNIIFADPPYMSDHCKLVTKLVAEKQLLKVNGLLIVEHSKDISVEPEGRELRLIECRPYGQSAFSFFVRREPPKEIVPTVKPIEVKEESKETLPPREFKKRPPGDFKGRRDFKDKREFREHRGSDDRARRGAESTESKREHKAPRNFDAKKDFKGPKGHTGAKKFRGPKRPPKPGTN